VGGAGIQEGDELGVVDVDHERHSAIDAQLDAGECVQGDGWLVGCWREAVDVVLIHDLNDEQLLAILRMWKYLSHRLS
jgi:hypothetical protein